VFNKPKQLTFERLYPAPATTVWRAWTEPELLCQWWAPNKTTVTECQIDLRLGGAIRVVMEAGEGMGKYRGTRWPMAGTFTVVNPVRQLAYDARSWTEGEEDVTTIEHTNTVTFTDNGASTTVQLTVAISKIGPKAKMAAFGLKWGYKAYLDKLDTLLKGTNS
jgi:uncharacterized protein YndB with AHSA1/START domain